MGREEEEEDERRGQRGGGHTKAKIQHDTLEEAQLLLLTSEVVFLCANG